MECSTLQINQRLLKNELRRSSTSVGCPSLNVSELRLVTFDLFGALMSTRSSMNRNIASLLPSLLPSDVEKFTNKWLEDYKDYFGVSFPTSLTHRPFLWVIRSSLLKILDSFGLSEIITENSPTFNALMSTWEYLEPYPGTAQVLKKLSRKYHLGLLSNGDKETLKAALRVFPSSVKFSVILSSDYPVNCFKNCSAMYAQALAAVNGNKNQVLHVAGSPYDAQGARAFGIFAGALDRSAINTNPKSCFAFDDIKELLPFFHL
ncbi:unnamed protein product [Rotaria sp. Silwood2]|nr:unnamed protein product [Rotaria sp. Silwood2]CAF2626402.1 unnamed protein product [Rotaria sp. Silwood2]CAF2851185.1 unnamed protein product [Rotaria sp. Silwood2]CAF2992924.1 unnamed protein product [Rotaria sp. Silwood2]CAF3965669.1 unnamed protein product [Rotaria sp. Silwood2]